MSRFESELRRRLASGESVQATAQWFIERMAEEDLGEELTEFERTFFERVRVAFARWRRRRKLN